jgi:hypothetical protein
MAEAITGNEAAVLASFGRDDAADGFDAHSW